MSYYYSVLQLQPGASPEDIKTSYRALVKKYHPDMHGGNAHLFSRVKEAYEILSDPAQRSRFERVAHKTAKTTRAKSTPFGKKPFTQASPPQPEKRATPAPHASLTRLMSVAIPRSGRLVLKNLSGVVVIEPTTSKNLWETTLKKFGADDKLRLTRHIIQVRVSGEKSHVRKIRLNSTEVGVEVSPAEDDQTQQLSQPLTYVITVPAGISLQIQDVSGSVTIGDLESEVRARISGRTLFKAGKIKGVGLTMKGQSKAHISGVNGNADVLGSDNAKVTLDGEIGRLRISLEQFSNAESLSPLHLLQAELSGNSTLNAKDWVAAAQVFAKGNSYVRMKELKTPLEGSRSGLARVEVLKRQNNMPLRNIFNREQAGAGG